MSKLIPSDNMTTSSTDAPQRTSMTRDELKSSASLAGVFAMRMLGLFLILPVFAVYAEHLPGGDSAFLVGLTIGIYGLTQSLFQIPFGIASDRLGRRRVIVFGLIIFALGSFLAAASGTIWGVMAGRALQGAGAISAAVTALIADSVRPAVITRSMAMVGASIGLMFALSLVIAPPLATLFGVEGLFTMTGVLALLAIGVVVFLVPGRRHRVDELSELKAVPFGEVFKDPALLRLNLGVFTLHAVQMALFVVVPPRLVEMGLPVTSHWEIYLPAVLIAFAVMVKPIIWAERRHRVTALLRSAAGILVATFLLFTYLMHSVWEISFLMTLFFIGFNLMEATLPGLVSRFAPPSAKGLALGIYNTTQSLGLFAGGALGGLLSQHFSAQSVFLTAGFAMLIWLFASRGLREFHSESADSIKAAS